MVTDYLVLERNVPIASAAVFLLGLGEELWKKFLPKYLEHLGASPIAVDGRTHHVYLPLENVGGKPVLRIALPSDRP